MKYNVIIDNQTYEVEIEDLRARPIVAIVKGERIEVEPQNGQSRLQAAPTSAAGAAPAPKEPPAPLPAAQGAAPASLAGGTKTVRAPIPGVIVALLVRPGDAVIHGQALCTIEAMKMRNNIRSGRAGRIAEILVSPGQTVNHNDPLMSFEE
jgi:biotin carboxyl carrier protein